MQPWWTEPRLPRLVTGTRNVTSLVGSSLSSALICGSAVLSFPRVPGWGAGGFPTRGLCCPAGRRQRSYGQRQRDLEGVIRRNGLLDLNPSGVELFCGNHSVSKGVLQHLSHRSVKVSDGPVVYHHATCSGPSELTWKSLLLLFVFLSNVFICKHVWI